MQPVPAGLMSSYYSKGKTKKGDFKLPFSCFGIENSYPLAGMEYEKFTAVLLSPCYQRSNNHKDNRKWFKTPFMIL